MMILGVPLPPSCGGCSLRVLCPRRHPSDDDSRYVPIAIPAMMILGVSLPPSQRRCSRCAPVTSLAVLLPAACCPWSSLCAWRSSAALCCQLFAALPRVAAAAACASWRLLSFHCPTLSWLLALAAVLPALALLRPAVHSVLLFVCLACSLIALPLLHVHAAALAHCTAPMSAHLRLCPAFLCRLPRCVAACCLRSVRRPLPRWFVVRLLCPPALSSALC